MRPRLPRRGHRFSRILFWRRSSSPRQKVLRRELTTKPVSVITMHKYDLSVTEFLQQSHSGSIDYNDFIINYLEALKEFNKKLRLMQCVNEKTIRPSAELYGLPVTVKDNICTQGMQSSAGSKILQGYVPPFDATAVSRIKDAGGFIAGKTNMDEFGHGTFSV